MAPGSNLISSTILRVLRLGDEEGPGQQAMKDNEGACIPSSLFYGWTIEISTQQVYLKCPTLREQRRMRDDAFLCDGAALEPEYGAPKFGVIERAGVWYPWMREDRDTAPAQMKRASR